MRLHVVQTADGGDLAAVAHAAPDGRAAAMSRRRALIAGRAAPGDVAEPVVTTEDVAAARLGRALSMQHRRQVTQGKQALTNTGPRALVVHPGGAR